MTEALLKPLFWVASSKRDLKRMPAGVVDAMGYALHLAQMGLKHPDAKPLKGFGSSAVLEVVQNVSQGAYRAVYMVQVKNAVYVLHCFQKKSKQGVATPKQEMDLVRLRLAEALKHAEREGS